MHGQTNTTFKKGAIYLNSCITTKLKFKEVFEPDFLPLA
jgi:hypothetical protein